ncbi:type II secretion system secretin GspD [Methylomarinum vadi]|uniref:type II secretion system secretin GspD n=1 Tax=Methylomarinum vadi TaxID=438855 RepID=UPI0004DF7D87|nr:type II secretion system secretin GspD [Methylomarinum vadi]
MVKKSQAPFLLTLLLASSGCELIGPKQHEKLVLTPVKQAEEAERPDIVYQELSNEALGKSASEPMPIELYPGSGSFTGHRAGAAPHKKGQGEYSLNFDEADLGEVVKVVLSDILGQNYLLSPKVGGKVTLQTTQPLTREELLPTLEMLLQVNGAGMVFQSGVYQIKPAVEVAGSGVFTGRAGSRLPAGHLVRVIPVKNVGVEDLAEIIKPLLDEKSILHIDPGRNLMLLAGTAAELARAHEMVAAFDIDVMKGKSFGLFPLRNVEAATLIAELEQLFNGDKEGGAFFRFMEIERLNAILAITHKADYLKEIESWVLRLDRANTSASGGVIVYRAQHVDAVELADTLNSIFGKGGGSSKASVASGRKSVQVTNKAQPDNKPAAAGANIRTPSLDNLGDVKIIPDEINNALVIVATAQDYAVIQRVIKQLDVMPLQVLIDATIVEVSLTDSLSYGIKWFLSHNNGRNAVSTGDNFATEQNRIGFTDIGLLKDTAANLAIGAATGGFGYGFVSDSGDVRAVLEASATNKNLNVISSPSLMVLNNQEASIQVGDEVPIRTSQSTNTSGGGVDPIQTSSIQQRQTGVKLKVKPRVNAGGLVIMEIEQSVENVSKTTVSSIDSPTIATREITSSVAVHSGETIVLGGLIKDDNTFNKAGIPFLHKLPLIGPLFGSTLKENVKTELVVLITPRVVKSKLDGRLVTDEFKRKLTGIYEEEAETGEEI